MNKFSIDATKAHPVLGAKDECDSAVILISEGLIEEAKKILFRVLAHQPNYIQALKLLKEIEEIELKEIFGTATKKEMAIEDINRLIENLDRDLGLNLDEDRKPTHQEIFKPVAHLSTQDLLDLGIAYVEMGCFSDALRELLKAEKKIRTEDSFLGESGLVIVSLIARCLIELGKPFEAKAFLEPVLVESDLKHEDKIVLYYEMGCIEQILESRKTALEWFKKVIEIDSQFKDAVYRVKLLNKNT